MSSNQTAVSNNQNGCCSQEGNNRNYNENQQNGQRRPYIPKDDPSFGVPPFLDIYEPYLRRTKPGVPVPQQGYAMCQFNPTHIVRAEKILEHLKKCPSRKVDDIFLKFAEEEEEAVL